MDRFHDIYVRARRDLRSVNGEDVKFLIAEIHRLRAIEDRALRWKTLAKNSSEQAMYNMELTQSLEDNPRPGS